MFQTRKSAILMVALLVGCFHGDSGAPLQGDGKAVILAGRASCSSGAAIDLGSWPALYLVEQCSSADVCYGVDADQRDGTIVSARCTWSSADHLRWVIVREAD